MHGSPVIVKSKRDRRLCVRQALLAIATATRISALLFLSSGTTTTAHENAQDVHVAAAAAAATVEIDAATGDIIATPPLAESAPVESIPTPTVQIPAASDEKEDKQNSESSSSKTNPVPYDVENVPCGIWVALSSIPNSGLGMYAGREFYRGEAMQIPGDIVIPIVDLAIHTHYLPSFYFLWDDYTWTADGLGMAHEGLDEVKAASPGFGSTANSFLALVNVDEENSSTNDDGLGLHRSKDPGVGAFTSYGDRRSTANRNIHVGEELFVSYGSTWFESRPHFGPVPLFEELKYATKLFRNWLRVKQYLATDNTKESSWANTLALELWETFVIKTAFRDSRTIGSFQHANYVTELQRLEETGMTLTQLRQEQATKSEEWLRKHGICGDHIRPGPSTIAQAGNGAFASRFLPKGTSVSLIPLIHITDKNRLRMYSLIKSDPDEDKYYPLVPTNATGYPIISGGWQLLLNYCYGHEESTLVLCPYGPMINYVNHNQTLANVVLRWPDTVRGGSHRPDLLQVPVQHLETINSAKLAMEIVATRDIAEGEEIFLDYGDAWERAWQDHVQNWKPVDGADRYKSAQMLNQELIVEGKISLKTDMEQRKDPYPSNVELHCSSAFIETLEDWEEAVEMGTTAEYLERLPEHDTYHECRVVGRTVRSNQTWYTAVAKVAEKVDDGDDDDENDVKEYSDRRLVDVPRQAFFFKDRPYTSNMFLENAFRHSIQIPDSMFPEQWKNL